MDSLDLNLENYDLEDILQLFNMPYLFNKQDLKNAKKIVARMHPDKSKLPKEYFLFFLNALKVLNTIYEFKTKNTEDSCPKNTTYTVETNKEHELILNKFKNKKNEFQIEFNKFFESNRLHNAETDAGYGKWLQSSEDLDIISSEKNMEQVFSEKKTKMRELAIHKDITEYTNQGNYGNLANDVPEEYSSDVFSKLRYDDIKKAHTETVVPVTHEDYLQHKRFGSVNEIKQYRQNQNITPFSLMQSKKYLADKQEKESFLTTQRAYSLCKQSEEATKINDKWWGKLQQLTHN
jgi:ssDNA-binding Zn-finger/Zn-ribbon topoisomerase 1